MNELIDLVTMLLIVLVAFLCGILATARAAREWAERHARELLDQYLEYEDRSVCYRYTATCGQVGCSHAWQWEGTYLDMPPCSACGWRPDQSELLALERMALMSLENE